MIRSQFLSYVFEELGDYERQRIREVAASRGSGRETLTFNVINVTLDFDQGVAVLEDELDVTSCETVPLIEFLSAIKG